MLYGIYITFIILIAGTDQENKKIYKEINIYGITISIMYMAYLCIIEKTSIYRYGIYLLLYIIILVLDTITLKKMAKSTYLNGILLLLITMAMFSGEFITVMSIIVTLLSIAIYIIIYKIQEDLKSKKIDKPIYTQISIGNCLCASNLIILIMVLAYNYYVL